MRRCSFFVLFASLAFLQDGFTAGTAAERDPAVPPNVILILADDLSVGDLNGGDGRPTRTRNLDGLPIKVSDLLPRIARHVYARPHVPRCLQDVIRIARES